MATSLLALLDDIGSVLDDVALLAKVAAKKTAGVLGDDLALNAHQVSGVRADRELPVVWAVARGSFVNKAILVPAALAVSGLAPWLVTPLLMLGGAYLCFEGAEKLAHRLLHSRADDAAARERLTRTLLDENADLVALERDKIRGAIRTDFVLSAEIIVIALGTVSAQPLATQLAVLAAVAVLMTLGVYGAVAAIVKLDDAGLWLTRRGGRAVPRVGQLLLRATPWLMRLLSVVGTAAMFLVGGGILVHGLPWVRETFAAFTGDLGGVAEAAAATAFDAAFGIGAGLIAVGFVQAAHRLFGRAQPAGA